MSVEVQSTILLSITPLTYICVGAWLLTKGQVLRAGLVTLAIALVPIVWLFTLPVEEVDAPGTGFLVMILFFPICLSLLTTLVGLGIALFKYLRRSRDQRDLLGAEA